MTPNRLQAAGLARAPHETGGVGGNVDPAHRRIKNVGSARSSAVAVQPRDGIAVRNRIVLVFGSVDFHKNRDVAVRSDVLQPAADGREGGFVAYEDVPVGALRRDA